MSSDIHYKGISISEYSITVHCRLYADDSTVYNNNINQINNILEAINVYEQASGAKLNIDKSSCIPIINSVKLNNDMQIINTNQTDRLLGIQIGVYSNLNNHWHDVITKAITATHRWKSSKYSLLIKAKVVKTFILSITQYYANFSIPSALLMKNLNTAIWQIFYGKQTKSRIAFDKCCLSIEYGGLNAFKVETRFFATIASWILRLKEGETETWKILFAIETDRIQKLPQHINNIDNGELPKTFLECGLVGTSWYYYRIADLRKSSQLKSLKDIYKALLPPPTVYSILNQSLECKTAKARWFWIVNMPANGKLHKMKTMA